MGHPLDLVTRVALDQGDLVTVDALHDANVGARVRALRAGTEQQHIAGARLAEVATLPPKDTMLSEFAGAIMSPVSNLVGLLQATMQEFVGLLDARAEQMA